jgi:hypothetical protein
VGERGGKASAKEEKEEDYDDDDDDEAVFHLFREILIALKCFRLLKHEQHINIQFSPLQ